MTTTEKTMLKVEALVNAPIEKVWNLWTVPEHIINWCFASPDWHTPTAENDLRVGGRFSSRMEAKDGSFGFDFWGDYTKVETNKCIEYTMGDGRTAQILFESKGEATQIVEFFEPESENSHEMQQAGWQAIMENFKKYAQTIDTLKALHFEISINAPASVVYSTMLDKNSYREWTALFNPTSYYEGRWEKGSKILFLGTDGEGKQGGMVSKIKENIVNEFVSIEHLGFVMDGKEVFEGPYVEAWAGALENYTFVAENGNTKLLIDMKGGTGEHNAYFIEAWPKALKKLKSICEK